VTATSGGAAVASYVYGADGGLFTQTEGTKTTVYLPGEQLTIDTSTSPAALSGVRFYALPGGITAVRTGSGSAYGFQLQSDGHGTSTLWLDSTAQVPAWRQFDPYGAPRGTVPATGFPGSRGFLGMVADAGIGLTDVGARWYDPVTGSFASLDPVLDKASQLQLNGYSYAGDNPVGSSDPSGQHPTDCTGGGCEGNVDGGNPWHGGPVTVPTAPPPGGSGGGGTATVHHGMGGHGFPTWTPGHVPAGVHDPVNVPSLVAGVVGSVVDADQGLRCQFMPLLCPQALQAVGLPSEGDLYHQALGALGISDANSDYAAGHIAGDIAMAFIPGAGEEEAAAAGAGAIDRKAAGLLGCSFTAATRVLLASGKTAPIGSLEPGDEVLATDTKTGKTTPETVTAVEVNHDTNLYDLRVNTAHGTQVIHTTANHPFWDPYLDHWIPASKLAKGERLLTANGTVATADGGTTPARHDGLMWDLTVPGNNDHDFYVAVAATAVLVHNCGEQGTLFDSTPYRASPNSENDTFLYQKLSPTGEHLKYGITKNPGTRYTSAELNGGWLNILASGSKQDMLALERSLHETLPIGPEEGQTPYIWIQVAKGLRPPPY
jgi:RHS repeat-associated protein